MTKLGLVVKDVVKIRGVNPYISVSKTIAAELKPGWKKPMPILLSIGSKLAQAHRVNLMPVGDGSFHLHLNGIVRKEAGVSVGDSIEASIQFDASYRNGPQHPMPRWFRNALKKNLSARKNWAALPPSRQKEVLRYFCHLKSVEARERNLARAMEALSGSPGRFMGRSWKKGR